MTNAAQRIDRGIREEFVADNIVSADKIDLIKKNNTDASEGTHASIPKPTTPVKKIILVLFIRLSSTLFFPCKFFITFVCI